MRLTSRMNFLAVLACTIALAAGCDSKPEPPQPNAKLEPEQPPPVDPNTGTPKVEPKVEPPKPVEWELDQEKHVLPAAVVKGRAAGLEVTPEAVIEGDELSFRIYKSGTPVLERNIKVKLAPMLVAGQPMPEILGRKWKVKFDAGQGPDVPEVWLEAEGKDPHLYQSGYAMTLELGTRKDNKVAGRIFLSLPDEQKSFLAGTFTATYMRPHTERPGSDDVPFINGEVTVTGAKPDAEVRIAYAAFTPSGIFFKDLQIPFDPVPELQARWTRDDTDKPRTSTLVAGDGNTRPARYEHVKLPPGRYLVSAGVIGGAAVWKWVNVQAGSAITENFSLDLTKTGGVEVTAPAEVKDRVYIAPADESDKPALDAELFRAIAIQVLRQDFELIGGKVLVKNLAPGKYEVRAGEHRGFVEVVADKTAELTLAPAKKP